jgi:small conductance mechanosensitive channel
MTTLQITRQVTKSAEHVTAKTLTNVERLQEYSISLVPRLVGAILLLMLGRWVIGKAIRILRKLILARGYDVALETFILSLVRISLNILLLLSVAGILGIDTTAFSALIVGAGVAIGSALNGTLGNFAGGVMMLIFKPFKVGDMVEAQGITGVVIEQGVFNTTVLTADNKTVFVPNGALSTGVITNYNTHGNLRVDISLSVANEQNIQVAKSIAIETMLSNPKVLRSPAPEVSVLKVADGVVTLAIRPYCVQKDYWDVYFGCMESVKMAWDQHKVLVPGPLKK